MTEAKALKLTRKMNEIAGQLNEFNAAKMAASALAEEELPGDELRPPVLPCTAIINGYVYIVNCKTGEIIP